MNVWITWILQLSLFFLCYEGMSQSPDKDATGTKEHNSDSICGVTSERLEKQMEKDPTFRRRRKQAEDHLRQYVEKWADKRRRSSQDTLRTIPVVFHVLYNDSIENLPRAQILSQLSILNKDFRRQNSDTGQTRALFDTVAADTRIQFCLANRDPQGFYTNGITRTYTSRINFPTLTDEMKDPSTGGKAAWPASDYLNFWICDLDVNPVGYATFPGGNPEDDGIVIDYEYIGDTLNSAGMTGRTGTHEAGHWLSLFHTFQNGCSGTSPSTCDTAGDRCCDTSPAANPYYGCPGDTLNDCSETPDLVNQWENFMAYTDGSCRNMFSEDQKDRMRATLAPGGLRRSITRSEKCDPILDWNADLFEVITPRELICDSNGFTPRVVLLNRGLEDLDSAIIRYSIDNQPFQSYYWDDSLSNGERDTIDLPTLTPSYGPHTFHAHIVPDSINGGNMDQESSNDSISSEFFLNTSSMGSGIGIHFWDICNGATITWKLLDSNGVTVANGGPYWNAINGAYFNEQVDCLPKACYQFRVYSSEGDGLSDPVCSTNDDYFILDGNGDTLTRMTAPNGAFGDSAVHKFCLDKPVVIAHDVSCNGASDGTIEVYPNDSIYQYSIDSGSTYQTGHTFANLGPGIYDVALHDTTNGATKYSQVNIQSPPALAIDSVDHASPVCGDSANGSISLFASGGVPPYAYSSDGGSTFQDSNVFLGMSTGTYTLLVEDSLGCSSSIIDSISEPSEIEALAGPDKQICKDEGTNIGNIPAITGGNGGDSIRWSPAASLDNPGIDTPRATPNTSTYYELLATDSNGCSDLDSVFVIVKPDPTSIINGDSVLNGMNDSILLDGTNSLSASGYKEYQWSAFAGGTIISPDPTDSMITVGSQGLYVLKVTDLVNGCTNRDSLYVKDVTGIDQKGSAGQIKVYPNPTKGAIHFQLGSFYKKVVATVRDVTGRVIATRRFENAEHFQVNLKGETGMYLIELRTNNGRKKILKVIRK